MEDRDDKTCGGEPFTQTKHQDEFETPIMILHTYMSHNLCVYLGLLQVLDGNQRITYNGLVQTERYIAQIHKRIRNESIKGQEENTLLLKHQKEKIDNLEETKTKLEKEKEDLEEKLKHSGSCPICWNPYDCDNNGGVSKKLS